VPSVPVHNDTGGVPKLAASEFAVDKFNNGMRVLMLANRETKQARFLSTSVFRELLVGLVKKSLNASIFAIIANGYYLHSPMLIHSADNVRRGKPSTYVIRAGS